MVRHMKRILGSPGWLVLIALVMIVAITGIRAVFKLFPVEMLDYLIIANLLLFGSGFLYQVFTGRRRRAGATLVIGVLMVGLAFAVVAIDEFGRASIIPNPWREARAELPDGMGSVSMLIRDTQPSNLPVPGWNYERRLKFRPDGRSAQIIELAELGDRWSDLVVYLIKTGDDTVLHIADAGDEPADTATNVYIDAETGRQVEKPIGQERRLGVFMRDSIHGFVFMPEPVERPRASGGLFSPVGIAVDPQGDVYVGDTTSGLIAKYTSDGQFITKWHIDDRTLNDRFSISVGPDGDVWVLSWSTSKLRRYKPDGKPSEAYNRGEGVIVQEPWDVSVAANGDVYVTRRGGEMVRTDDSGRVLARWGNADYRVGPGMRGVQALSDGNVLVGSDHNRIIRYTPEGKQIGEISPRSRGGWPVDIAVDSHGNIYAGIYYGSRFTIEVYAPDGSFLRSWDPGIKDREQPAVTIAAGKDHIYVTDVKGHRVLKFTTEGKPVIGWGE